MTNKNPNVDGIVVRPSKPLKIQHEGFLNRTLGSNTETYAIVLSNLAIAESNLVKTGHGLAMPHFIAIVKELEKVLGFTFEIMEE